MRRLARYLLRPLVLFAIRRMRVNDPWAPASPWIALDALGTATRRPFSWYLEGTSAVATPTIDDVCAWLCRCEYASDPALFNEADFWQHPLTFEQLQRGDCEDHALWAWRKLLELGVDARFVIGSWRQPGKATWGVHAWVEYVADGTRFHIEPVRHDREHMVRPLAEVREHYAPHFSVDRSLEPATHAGLILYWQRNDTTGSATSGTRHAAA